LPFLRKRPRVTVANNAEIDVIWDKWRRTLEPLRIRLNAALGKSWEGIVTATGWRGSG